jgi:TonB family protein
MTYKYEKIAALASFSIHAILFLVIYNLYLNNSEKIDKTYIKSESITIDSTAFTVNIKASDGLLYNNSKSNSKSNPLMPKNNRLISLDDIPKTTKANLNKTNFLESNKTVVVSFLLENGTVKELKILESSGSEIADNAATDAILLASKNYPIFKEKNELILEFKPLN